MVKISIFIFEGSRSFRERAGGKSQNKTRGRNLTCVDSQAKIPRVPKKGKLNKLELYTNREKRKEQKEGGTKIFNGAGENFSLGGNRARIFFLHFYSRKVNWS